jgi:aromatic-L-amino-acid decarboxylase
MKPEVDRFEELLGAVGADLDTFVSSSGPDPVSTAHQWRPALDHPLPEVGAGIDAVVDLLREVVIPAGSRITDPGFWGFITAGPSTAPALAATAAMIASPQRYTATSFNFLEELSLEWLADLCGLGPHMKGVYSSGGSTANLVALGGARQHAFETVGIDVSATGFDGRRAAIYTSSEAHHTIQRSAGALGIGRSMVRSVAADSRQRMDVAALRAAIQEDIGDGIVPVAIAATAGTTNTGALDPLAEIAAVAGEFGVWLHVDGAYGLPGILDERVSARFAGLELADSAIVDPHKWLGAPVGVAATFVRDRSILHRAFTQEPSAYLEGSFAADDDVQMSVDSMGIPYGDMGVELSAPARGVMVWAILVEQGRSGVAARIAHDNDSAQLLTGLADEHPRLEALTEPELSIACVRYHRPDIGDLDDFNSRLLRRVLRETDFMPSGTVVGDRFAIRPCFINVRSEPGQVERLADQIVELGDSQESG